MEARRAGFRYPVMLDARGTGLRMERAHVAIELRFDIGIRNVTSRWLWPRCLAGRFRLVRLVIFELDCLDFSLLMIGVLTEYLLSGTRC